MKKHKALKIICLIILITIVGTGVKMNTDKVALQKEMIKVVKSDEAKKLFEHELKNLDSKALTSEGIIRTYKIKYDSIEHNQMGGINVDLIINNDPDMEVGYILDRYTEKLETGGVDYSDKLSKKLGEE